MFLDVLTTYRYFTNHPLNNQNHSKWTLFYMKMRDIKKSLNGSTLSKLPNLTNGLRERNFRKALLLIRKIRGKLKFKILQIK